MLAALVLEDSQDRGPRRLLGVGFLIGLSAATEFLSAIPGAVLLAFAWWRAPQRLQAGLLLLGGMLGPVLVLFTINTLCFGAPWRTGYNFVVIKRFVEGHASGLMGVSWPQPEAIVGLLLSPSRGLLVVAPIAAVGLVGVVTTLRSRRDPALVAMALAGLALFLANSGYYMWWGGASAGPRHLLPALPLLGVGLAATFERKGAVTAVAMMAGLWSIATMVAFAAIGIEAPEDVNVLTQYLWPALSHGRLETLAGSSNLGVYGGLPAAGSLGPLLAWMVLGARWLLVTLEGPAVAAEPVVAT